jgi:hypothetical protein
MMGSLWEGLAPLVWFDIALPELAVLSVKAEAISSVVVESVTCYGVDTEVQLRCWVSLYDKSGERRSKKDADG